MREHGAQGELLLPSAAARKLSWLCETSLPSWNLSTPTDNVPEKRIKCISLWLQYFMGGITIDICSDASPEFLQKSCRTDQPCLSSASQFPEIYLPPDTRMHRGMERTGKYRLRFHFLDPHDRNTLFLLLWQARTDRIGDLLWEATDSCYSISDWIQGLSTTARSKKAQRSLLNSMRCSCRVWRSLPDIQSKQTTDPKAHLVLCIS